MTRIHKWKDFETRSRDLFAKNPDSTRFSIKQTTSSVEKDGIPKKKVTVVLRVTDDKETLTYHTSERFSAKRIAALMKWFTVKMASAPVLDQTALKQPLSR